MIIINSRMWGWIILIGIFVVPGFLGWAWEKIQEFQESERSRRRDEIAVAVFEEYGIMDADFENADKAINHLSKIIPNRFTTFAEKEVEMPSAVRSRQGQMCQKCKMGYFVRRRGPYGEFLGCSMYPMCKNKKPITWVDKRAKEASKNKIREQFSSDLEKAYS